MMIYAKPDVVIMCVNEVSTWSIERLSFTHVYV